MKQRRFSRRLVLLFVAGFLALVLAPAAPASAETILKVATMSGGPGTPVPDLLVRFAKGVEQRTGGQIKIRIYWANSLVHAKEVLEAVQIGTTDIGHLAVSYFSDKLRLITVATLPFSVNDPVKMRNNMLRVIDTVPEVRKEWERFGHVAVSVFSTGSFQLPSRTPIRNLADLQGKKVGGFGRIVPKVVHAAGAVPVSITAGEMYQALQRGTIDARVLSYEATKRFKLFEVTKYISEVDLGGLAGVNLITINRGRWEGLTPEQRKIILEVGKEAGAWEAQAMKDGDVKFKQELVSKGMKVVEFSEDDRNKWKNSPAVKKIAQDWVEQREAQGLPGKRVLSLYQTD